MAGKFSPSRGAQRAQHVAPLRVRMTFSYKINESGTNRNECTYVVNASVQLVNYMLCDEQFCRVRLQLCTFPGMNGC